MKKTPPTRQSESNARSGSWHNDGDIEIAFYTRSLRKAANILVAKLELDQNPATEWDACPIILLYREALEIQLKLLVGEGSNFLPSPTDPITLYKTRSSRWLAQIVCQIIRAVKWEGEFTCEGVSSLAVFTAVVHELEALDPVSRAVHSSGRGPLGSSPVQLRPASVVQLTKTVDALLVLLDETADALAAEWNLRKDEVAGTAFGGDGDYRPTIQ